MAVDSSHFISEAAECLANASVSEIKLRASVSRAYYGLYHAGLIYADSIHVPPVSDMSGPSHKKLSAFFENNFHKDQGIRRNHRRLGYVMKQLHEQRVTADYRLNAEVAREVAEAHLNRCMSMLDLIATLKSAEAA
ncbi:hypothetical protein DFO61_3317 [Ectopseudomonas oleovorans]|uniref:HEPN domain-containing protein n=1 Tax=Ectopseudomonas oleovorans TaxID=301 RepID=A0A397MIP3_ECTOL|nr:hypothetical protein [Pseudomonas oleovorans]RIA22627.1 hypothetical protein DFO61_3317 [Pseudomonas oleovorans]